MAVLKRVWTPVIVLERVLRQVTIGIGRLVLALLVLFTIIYFIREVRHDVVIIDPFTVPKHFEETGLTSEVVANRIGDAFRQIELNTQTVLRKDELRSLHDEEAVQDVEIVGTRLGLKTIVDIVRDILGKDPKHIRGDITMPVSDSTSSGLPLMEPQATVTVYVTQGRSRNPPTHFEVPYKNMSLLAQRAAEVALRQVNPLLFALHLKNEGEYEKAADIIEEMIREPKGERRDDAFFVWADVLRAQKRYEEAGSKYQEATEFNPKNAFAYNNWGGVLYEQNRYEEAIAKYQKAIEINPKLAAPYNNWGASLSKMNKYEEATAKIHEAIKLNPKLAGAYVSWGFVLGAQNRYEEAIAKIQKGIELDPKLAIAYNNWGDMLFKMNKYEEATPKIQEAIKLDPKYALAYNSLGNVLNAQKRHKAAAEKYQKATELDPKFALAYKSWGDVLNAQKRYKAAAEKYQKATELDPKFGLAYNNWGRVLIAQRKSKEADEKFAKYRQLLGSH